MPSTILGNPRLWRGFPSRLRLTLDAQKMTKRKANIILAIIAVILAASGLHAVLMGSVKSSTRPGRAQLELRDLADAVLAYHSEYGTWPPLSTTNNAALVLALDGENPNHTKFMDFPLRARPTTLHPQASFLDPWRVPYRFATHGGTEFTVWSFGPNRTDQSGAGDDITVRRSIQP